MNPHPAFTARRLYGYAGWSLLAWLSVAAICLCLGSGGVLQWWPSQRLDRVLIASLIGAALSIAGVTFQALLRNPLASPSILGISSGASVGVILGLFLQRRFPGTLLSQAPPHLLALLFALLTILLVYLLAQRRGHIQPLSLLLVGVMVSAFNGALIMVLNLLVPYGVRANFVVWLMGMISQTLRWSPSENPEQVWLGLSWLQWSAIGVGAGFFTLLGLTYQFNLQSLGEQTAQTLGVRVRLVRLVSFVVASLVTAVAVSLSGPIGFVGLICPHICRSLFGPDHRVLMVTAAAFGAIFLLSADTAVRTLSDVTGGQIPVGVVTAMCGGPFFIYLLRRHLRRREP